MHTTILFSGSCEAGKAAARTLHVKLLGDVRPLFYVPAPRARSLFGNVYMITVSHPYLVRAWVGRGALHRVTMRQASLLSRLASLLSLQRVSLFNLPSLIATRLSPIKQHTPLTRPCPPG